MYSRRLAMKVLLYGLACACLGLTTCSSAEESRASAHDWCLKKWAETAVRLHPIYRPTPDEVKQGHNAFMRECMSNQGHVWTLTDELR